MRKRLTRFRKKSVYHTNRTRAPYRTVKGSYVNRSSVTHTTRRRERAHPSPPKADTPKRWKGRRRRTSACLTMRKRKKSGAFLSEQRFWDDTHPCVTLKPKSYWSGWLAPFPPRSSDFWLPWMKHSQSIPAGCGESLSVQFSQDDSEKKGQEAPEGKHNKSSALITDAPRGTFSVKKDGYLWVRFGR